MAHALRIRARRQPVKRDAGRGVGGHARPGRELRGLEEKTDRSLRGTETGTQRLRRLLQREAPVDLWLHHPRALPRPPRLIRGGGCPQPGRAGLLRLTLPPESTERTPLRYLGAIAVVVALLSAVPALAFEAP